MGRDIELWLEIQQQAEAGNQLLKQSNVTSNYLEKERNAPSSSNDTDTLLLDNATTPAGIEGSIVKLEPVKNVNFCIKFCCFLKCFYFSVCVVFNEAEQFHYSALRQTTDKLEFY